MGRVNENEAETVEDDPYPQFPYYFKFAREVSKRSNYKIKVGAVAVRKGTPIGRGYNKQKCPNHHFITEWDTTHAEVALLRSLVKCNLRGTTLYVYREDKQGNPKLAKPCPYCETAIKKAGIRKVYYSVEYYPYWKCEYI